MTGFQVSSHRDSRGPAVGQQDFSFEVGRREAIRRNIGFEVAPQREFAAKCHLRAEILPLNGALPPQSRNPAIEWSFAAPQPKAWRRTVHFRPATEIPPKSSRKHIRQTRRTRTSSNSNTPPKPHPLPGNATAPPGGGAFGTQALPRRAGCYAPSWKRTKSRTSSLPPSSLAQAATYLATVCSLFFTKTCSVRHCSL